LELYWEGRVYLPTSENSERQNTIAKLRNNFILSRHLGKYGEVELDQKYNYYLQSRTAYKNSFTDEEGYNVTSTTLTKRMEIEHMLRLWGKIQDDVALGWTVGSSEEYWNKSAAAERARPGLRRWLVGPSLAFPITKRANFIFTYQDTVNRDENKAELWRFLPKNTQFALFSFINF